MSSTQPTPVAIVCVGMAGSGKTTFMQRINAHLHTLHQQSPSTTAPPYVVNLDPAVRSVPFESNIDIRDSVNYKEVMKQYNLGPNGGILTSLNLFSTKIDQVMGLLEKRCLPSKQPPPQTTDTTTPPKSLPSHILLDTPGQIEVFVWSASGQILLSSLASSFPTVLAYIIDTPRTTASTSTFMSNMLYAISILYKTRLPMILVFNKTDVKDEGEAVEWMRDFEAFQAALRAEEEEVEMRGGSGGAGYMGSLLNSMSLVLEEFYNALSVVGVSSMTGDGVERFFEAVEGKRQEFEREYQPELERRRRDMDGMKAEMREKEVRRMMGDMGVSSKAKGTGKYAKSGNGGRIAKEGPETVSDVEEMEADEDDGLEDPDHEMGTGMEEEDDVEFEESLKKRYEDALKASGGPAATVKSAEYIRRTQG
ncbi:hypothetical protein LTR78_007634 [Recurvomyces mirabilis]|uniref:GPN-loop GTPase n=1 Tax=Recurvomyces mirabilis TaxID=574656 RepID=A0AAE0TUQ0_9PEZI|nr:hypothetical protein LTR78_007634 [Recurvomyces mirabilis]KAK5159855.1 hypothetical protein LTS14_001960 [Recurvomyces mirabilis]